ncbi:lycopene cyclase domain-containing protein [Halorussus marinus]|uniref:lycopene cyclase domain-containing protein n=1 Tax=Halorussus marinus TaxID=2505976 RepID=UPI00106EE917|nr:lycopene cyclase domain-containing protein [Halorussus marinus]
MSTITYFQFHVALLVPALLVLSAISSVRRRAGSSDVRPSGVVVVSVVALAYTIPWDNYLIEVGVWRYGTGAVAVRIWNAPLEEYLFILIQPILVALWLHYLKRPPKAGSESLSVTRRARIAGAAAGLGIGGVGLGLLARPATLYLGAILAWAGPVLALQWGFGWPYLWRRRRTLAIGVGAPTAYLWAADWLALRYGIWELAPAYTTGWNLAGLPVEEATFFAVTNLFVVQGLLLYAWVLDGRRRPSPTEKG